MRTIKAKKANKKGDLIKNKIKGWSITLINIILKKENFVKILDQRTSKV